MPTRLLTALLSLLTTSVWAIDLMPGDVRAPQPDRNFALMSYSVSTRGDLFRDGQQQAGDPSITTTQGILRLGRTFTTDGLPAAAYIQTAHGQVRPGGSLTALESDSGLSDTSLAIALWPHADHDTETYFALGAYLMLPTGSYSHLRPINVGGNRYQTALQAGFQKALTPQLHGMLVFDTVWSGKNDAFGATQATLAQRALNTWQMALLYQLDSRYSLGANYYHTYGGETRVNGLSRNDRTRLERYQLTAKADFSFGRLTLQYGADLDTANGYFEDRRWVMRFLRLF